MKLKRIYPFSISLAALFLTVPTALRAATLTWTAGTGDVSGTWDATTFNGQNYTGSNDFIIDGSATKTITLSGAIPTPNSFTVSASGSAGLTTAGVAGTGAVTLSGTALGGTLTKSGTAELVLASANRFGAVSLSNGKIFLNNQDGLGTTGTLSLSGTAATKASFSINSYSAGIANQFFLDTSAQTGSMNIQKAIAFGSPASATTYAMVMGSGSFTNTLSGNLTGNANVNLWLDDSAGSTSATWALNGNNSGFLGKVRVNRGNLSINSANSLGSSGSSLTFDANSGSTFFVTNSFTFGQAISFGTTVSNFNIGTNNVTATGVISGSATQTKLGAGTLTLSNAGNTYSSTLTVGAGTLNLTGAFTSTTANITVNSGAVLTGTGSTAGTIALNAGSAILATAAGSVQGATVTAGATTNIYVNAVPSASPVTLDVIRYTGTSTAAANFTAAPYRSGSITDDTANKKITLTYTGAARTWAATAGDTWDVGTSTPWMEGDNKFFWGDSVAFGNTADQVVTLTGSLAPTSVTVSAANAYTFSGSGSIVGAGSLTKSGAGTLTLSTTNTYSGGTTISAGTLSGATAAAFGSGTITYAGTSSLIVANSAADTLSNNIILGTPATATTYTLVKNSASASTGTQLTLSGNVSGGNANTTFFLNSNTTSDNTTQFNITGNNTFAGIVNLNRGQLLVGNANALGTATLNLNSNASSAGDLQFASSVSTFANNIVLQNGSNPIAGTAAGVTLSGVISGAATPSLNKVGTGTLALTGSNTYTGPTVVTAGTLSVGASGGQALGGTGSVTVNTGGTLLLSTANQIKDTATVSLGGGTFNTGGLSETVGVLSLTTSSTIDFGSGASVLHFADSHLASWTGTLSIYNWSGVNSSTDQLFFGTDSSGLSPTQLGQLSFYSDSGTTFLGSGSINSVGELEAVPEPSTVTLVVGMLGLVGWRERRRFRRPSNGKGCS